MSNTIERTRYLQSLIYLQNFSRRSTHPAAGSQDGALTWALAEFAERYPDEYRAAVDHVSRRRRPTEHTHDQ